MHNARAWRRDRQIPPRIKQRCVFEGCEKWRVSHGYCATHWARVVRHGDPAIVQKSGRKRSGKLTVLKNEYLMAYEPEHPLANKSGQVLEHRRVLYDIIGPETHACHMCGRPVGWGASRPDRLDVDHLDGDRQNNEPSNLAPACPGCNDQRRNP